MAAAVAYVPLVEAPSLSSKPPAQPSKPDLAAAKVAQAATGKVKAAIPLGAAGKPPPREFIENIIESATPIVIPEGSYQGQHEDNKPHGKGRLTYMPSKIGYFGDKDDSNCKYKFLSHTGLFENGMPHGNGQLTVQFTEDGKVFLFEGTWTRGKLKGPGRMILLHTAASRTGSWNEDGSFTDDSCCCC